MLTRLHLRAFAFAVSIIPAAARAQSVPPIVTTDLNKTPIVWPRDFMAERTVLIVAFTGNQQGAIDRWVAGLGLKAPGAVPWYEVPMINDPGSLGRWFINRGMRGGIPDSTDRAHVVTVYGDKREMMQRMGLPDQGVHVLVVDREGRIVLRESGEFSDAGKAKITTALLADKGA
jgi:hypothetical protein